MISTESAPVKQSGREYISETTNKERSPNQQLLPLTAKINSEDHLEIGGCDVTVLIEQFGSPLYILDEETLRTSASQYREALNRHYPGESQVLYASKAWNCLAICAICGSEGLGIDVVSAGELYTAIQAGVSPDKIYLHGNNKSRAELELAIETGSTIVVDNWWELETLVAIASENPNQAPIRMMVRFTPGIECHTHDYIKTGHLDSKFGFDPVSLNEVFQFISQQPSFNCIGIHCHIGSQIFEIQPHQDLPGVMAEAFQKGLAFGLPLTEINIGGGLGIRYTEADDPPSIETWVEAVAGSVVKACQERELPLPKILCEPGRSLVGPACVTAYTIGAKKEVPGIRTYVSVDGGMSDNPRPITYQSLYRAVIANKMSAANTDTVTVAGKHCESGDVLIKDVKLPSCEPGDCLVVIATGAYNCSMASNYNRVPRPAAVLVGNGFANVIIQRETYQDLLQKDRLPERLLSN